MSCPYFYPQTPAPEGSYALPARVPLGVMYRGECHADPSTVHASVTDVGGDCCNFGYGHGVCGNFPPDAEADAVRFSLSRSRELLWILEKDFAPLRYGCIGDAGSTVKRQAEVFLENYERHIARAPGPRIDL
jgi:hypothetical protein